MERLTNKREADAQREEYERRLTNGYPRNIPEERFLRLASYEDSGCEPEKVMPKDKADEIALKLMRLADLESLCNYTRLRELAEADKDGRVVVPPCKVGDMVWVIAHPWTDKLQKKPLVAYVNGMKLFPHGLYVNVLFDTIKINGTRDYGISRIGKTVFLTREEAEKALEEMEGKKDGNETSM